MDLTHDYTRTADSDEEADAAETPAEARVRLAKMYLQGLSSTSAPTGAGGEGDDFFESEPAFGLGDAAQADRENIAARLQKDVAEQSGRLHLFVANRIAPPSTKGEEGVDYSTSMLAVRGHRLSVTSAVASADAKWLFTASKDGSIMRWRLRDGKLVRVLPKRPKSSDTLAKRSKSSGAARRRARMTPTSTYLPLTQEQGHTDEIWSLSLSSDGTYLASGGKDKRICIWSLSSPSSESFIKTLSGHKDSITSLSFRPGSSELYTASLDRTLKLFDIGQLSYIETLFGHQESVLSLSCLNAETAVSAGGRDRTCRYWKIRDESQLVFRAGIKSKLREVLEGGDLAAEGKMASPTEAMEGSVEVVSMIDSHHFLSGGDSGTISLWNLGKKKPIFTAPVAHGFDVTISETEGSIRTPRWITSLAALPYGDLFVSGSWDGSVRVWGLTMAGGQIRGFKPLFSLPVEGVVNSLHLVSTQISSVVVDETGVRSTAVREGEWKRRHGLSTNLAEEEDGEEKEEQEPKGAKLNRVQATKDNCPPLIIAGIGQEHKFGRWVKKHDAKNGALVIPLRLTHPSSATPSRSNGHSRDVEAGSFNLI